MDVRAAVAFAPGPGQRSRDILSTTNMNTFWPSKPPFEMWEAEQNGR